MDDLCEVTITAPDEDWLAAFVRRLVEDGLCAAAHIDQIRSQYRWQGSLYDRAEARAILHTRTGLFSQIAERTQQEHPYEVPGLVAVPMVAGIPAYAQWIRVETGDEPDEV